MNGKLKALLRETPIVVTGMGAVSAAGLGQGALWEAVLRGHSLARLVEGRHVGCAVPQGVISRWPTPLLRKADRTAQLAYLAATEAWQQAGLGEVKERHERLGIFAGTSRGPVSKLSESIGEAKSGRVRPSLAASCTLAGLSGTLAAHFLAGGPALTVSSACASSAAAIALAAEQLLLGQVDIALAGGSEAPLVPVVFEQLAASGLLGQAAEPAQVCRPFDLHRNGIVLGEGAAFLILETEENAKARGAAILARLGGWSVRSEGGERTGISEDAASLVRVMQEAMDLADVRPEQIGYVNAHGTGTVLNDRQEAVALHRAFGGCAGHLPCSSIKAVTGHTMGAAGAMEAVVCIQALQKQMLPPSANYQAADPAIELHLVKEACTAVDLSHVLSNSSGFWGNNAALVFSRNQA